MGRISPGPTRWPPGAERRLVPAKSDLKPQTSSRTRVWAPPQAVADQPQRSFRGYGHNLGYGTQRRPRQDFGRQHRRLVLPHQASMQEIGDQPPHEAISAVGHVESRHVTSGEGPGARYSRRPSIAFGLRRIGAGTQQGDQPIYQPDTMALVPTNTRHAGEPSNGERATPRHTLASRGGNRSGC